MFNENEIACFLDYPEVMDAVLEKKKSFITSEAKFLEISDHDFLSLIMMTPSVGIALANGSVSLFEELALNKLARKMSKGGYFLKIDPVAHAMKFFIKSYDKWEMPFIDVILLCMEKSFNFKELGKVNQVLDPEVHLKSFAQHLMVVPYGFTRFLSAFFINDDNDIARERSISRIEYEKIEDLGRKLEVENIPIYQEFLKTFKIK